MTFTTDETLSQSGFWIRLHGYQQCNNDEYLLGSKCIKIFHDKQTWNFAQEKCLSIDSRLIHLNDIVQEKKLTHFLLTNSGQQTSFWISDEKDKYDGKKKNSFFFKISISLFMVVHSWWPWRSSLNEGKCVLRTQDGWLKRPCEEFQAFICERDINRQSIPLTVRCGNAQSPLSSTIITTITTTASTRRPTVSFIQPPIVHEDSPSPIYKQQVFVPPVVSSIKSEQAKTTVETKSSSIDPSMKNIISSLIIPINLFFFQIFLQRY